MGNDIINGFIKTLRTGSGVSKYHRDYILIKELYHCSPSELELQDEHILSLHYNMIMQERKENLIEMEREKQRAASSHKKK